MEWKICAVMQSKSCYHGNTANVEVIKLCILKITVDMFSLQNTNAALTTIKKRQLKQFLIFHFIMGWPVLDFAHIQILPVIQNISDSWAFTTYITHTVI